MTRPDGARARVELVGLDGSGGEVARVALRHGESPDALLAAAGWRLDHAVDVTSTCGAEHLLTISFRVSPLAPRTAPRPGAPDVRTDRGLPRGAEEHPVRAQRVAAYAVVTSGRGVLMTELSERTNAPGRWGLPGGGIEPGEHPRDAAVREVWEESGQHVTVDRLVLLQTSHWVGRAPGGRLEDFHAVRIVFAASCSDPTDPVVHDVGGTTSSAAWLTPDGLATLPMTAGWRAVAGELGLSRGA